MAITCARAGISKAAFPELQKSQREKASRGKRNAGAAGPIHKGNRGSDERDPKKPKRGQRKREWEGGDQKWWWKGRESMLATLNVRQHIRDKVLSHGWNTIQMGDIRSDGRRTGPISEVEFVKPPGHDKSLAECPSSDSVGYFTMQKRLGWSIRTPQVKYRNVDFCQLPKVCTGAVGPQGS
ncbi:hypothetical protein B0H14DRAFT_2561814 [Mycena olivaceomarginata]|nr:hypothetical protein B0H14DRAFT_2561814 [Mycena olivaceomarginata]